MPDESMLYLRQVFSQFGSVYLEMSLLLGLLVAAIFRPERIRVTWMFRLSCLLLAASVVVMPLLTVLMALWHTDTPSVGRSPRPVIEDSRLLMLFFSTISPILLALSIIFGVFSLVPGDRSERWPRQPMDS